MRDFLQYGQYLHTSRDGAFGPVYLLVVCDLSLIQTFEIQTAATEIVKMRSIFKIKLLKMIVHPSKDLSAIVYIWRFTTNSDRKSTKWWAIWFRSRLFGFVCHKSLIGHIRHQWPCHISRNFNKVFSWETTWTSENPKKFMKAELFWRSSARYSFKLSFYTEKFFFQHFLFLGILRHVRLYLVNVYVWNQRVQFFNSCFMFL